MKKVINILVLIAVLSATTSCVKDEMYQAKAIVSELSHSPQAPQPGEEVTVRVKVIDNEGVKSVNLFYRTNGQSFQKSDMQAAADNYFTALIPGQADGTTVNYYVEVVNSAGLKSLLPEGAPATAATYTIGAPLIVMNEIYSRGTVEEPDWIEIYNASDITVNIGNFAIYDNGGQSGITFEFGAPFVTVGSTSQFAVPSGYLP